MAKHITITAEYVRSRIDYDPETGILTWKARPVRNPIDKMWNTRFAGTTIRHTQTSGYIQFKLDGKNYLGQHIAWVIAHGVWPAHLVDHENRIRDDNRLSNLRDATRSQNNSNTKPYSNNTLGFRGAWQNGKRWAVRISSQGKRIYCGTYDSKEDAARAYDVIAKQVHGEFATLNFPLP
ncbi:HNH endonuclease [Mesorhizobium sp.]|uniref:HNH endonuclease n=1 Tax=Mesorhizobium sp. TaxID=1871066 RepID=UPI000FE64BF3|nr:HNH endonuclease [Mesorhizobium sp.]RWO22811.1 MAG: hypothetical protein EOS09_19265 [Mesorhizobium sp.]